LQILAACTKALQRLAVDPRNAETIARAGGMDAILTSLRANPNTDSQVSGRSSCSDGP
jgi:hypothetical protein